MKRILVADDNAAIREMLRDALEDRFEVVEAPDGRDALEKIAALRPDLVLLDIGMPALDGFEVLRRVRQDPALAGVRIAALTAFAMESDRERAMAAGFDAYISKPVELRALRAEVERLAGVVS
jgi:CheY-like chemotaxis protein